MLIDPPALDALRTPKHQATEKCAGREHDGAALNTGAIRKDDAAHHPSCTLLERSDLATQDVNASLLCHRALHRRAIQPAISLHSGTPHGGTLTGIQHAPMDGRCIGGPGHDAVEGIDLANEMPFAKATNGRVAGHLADPSRIGRDQRDAGPATRSSGRSLGPCMTAADNDDIETVHSSPLERMVEMVKAERAWRQCSTWNNMNAVTFRCKIRKRPHRERRRWWIGR
ncbi:hypothetical protein HNP60_003956 [Sphingobium sp. B1D3A]|uniref:Uncharacterized protein n=1 Tax=Sphingobium lignivorans TaxID=2735886 RepID=A0ABR6NMR0_9SPHN|nr:hypothetical protein [Sphingobium lignivorans]